MPHRLQERRLSHSRSRLEDDELALPCTQPFQPLRNGRHLPLTPNDAGRAEPVECCLREYFLWIDFARAGGLVSSRLLRVVEGRVGGVEQVPAARRVSGGRRNPDTQCDREGSARFAESKSAIASSLQDPRRHLSGSSLTRSRQQHGELVAAKADWHPLITDDLLQRGGHPDEHLVAGVVPVGVVDLLELVQVDDQERQGEIIVALPPDLVLEVAEQETAIVNAGQLVLEDETRGILPDVFKEFYELAVLHGAGFPLSRGWERQA